MSLGGLEPRYRIGLSYQPNADWQLTATYMSENYATKTYNSGTTDPVTVNIVVRR